MDATPPLTDGMLPDGAATDAATPLTDDVLTDDVLTDDPVPDAPVPAVEHPVAPAASTRAPTPVAIHLVTMPMSARLRLQE